MLLLLLGACGETRSAVPDPAVIPGEAPVMEAYDPFAVYLDRGLPIADGFRAPVTGARWARCGDGCYERPSAADVVAVADGVIQTSDDGLLKIRHRWLENQHVRETVSVWSGLRSTLAPGARVEAGDLIGQTAHLELGLDPPEPSTDGFLAARPTLFDPWAEPVLALVSHAALELRLYQGGVEQGRYAISLGQADGAKEELGDRKTPQGMYFVTQRSRGPFDGDYGAYYGGIWLRLNYPNAWDAARGVDAGLITAAQQRSISRAWRARETTLQRTGLGSGIGVHAWAQEWDNAGSRHLSWGCLVVHPSDAEAIYAALPEGTMVVLF